MGLTACLKNENQHNCPLVISNIFCLFQMCRWDRNNGFWMNFSQYLEGFNDGKKFRDN